MWRAGLVILVGLSALIAGSWSAGRNSVETKPRTPTEAERIIAFCSDKANQRSPLCAVKDPEDSDSVRDAVRDVIERQTTGPRVIERRETIREGDDDAPAPRVTVVVPRQTSPPARTTPTPARTTPPPALIPEVVPEIPIKVPNMGLPLLP